MHWKRWLVVALIGFGVVAAVRWGYKPQPILVEAAEARRGPLQVTIDEEGKTRVRDRYTISAPLAGYLRRIRLEVGDAVKAGQPVAQLEPLRPSVLDPRSRAETEARVAAAEAALRAAKQRAAAAEVDAAYWQGELERVKKLRESGDIPGERYDRTVTEHDRAQAAVRTADRDVEVAEADLETARASLRYAEGEPATDAPRPVEVRAPVAGRVLTVVRKSEGVVNPGDALIEVANARVLEVAVEVLSADAVRITPGMRVLLERWGGDAPLEARVRLIEPVAFTKISALGVEEQRVLAVLDIVSPAEVWQRLGDGYRVEAKFVVWDEQDVLQVPSSALFRHQDGWAVFAIEEGHARRRPVEAGHRNGMAAQILSGLEPGAIVITHPDTAIEDGTLVSPRTTP